MNASERQCFMLSLSLDYYVEVRHMTGLNENSGLPCIMSSWMKPKVLGELEFVGPGVRPG